MSRPMDELQQLLKNLHLRRMAESLPEELQRAEQEGLAYTELLLMARPDFPTPVGPMKTMLVAVGMKSSSARLMIWRLLTPGCLEGERLQHPPFGQAGLADAPFQGGLLAVVPLGADQPSVLERLEHQPGRSREVDQLRSAIVDRALHRAGITRPSRGAAHLLRHSVATAMLRHGASLHDVAALLRHRSIETTQIYAKVDVIALQTIAQPWPEVPPC
jgi:hypothetical protein